MPNEFFEKNLNDGGLDRLAKELQYNKEKAPENPVFEIKKNEPVIKQDVVKDLHKESDIPTLRTYATDIRDAVKKQNESVLSIQIKEQQKQSADEAGRKSYIKSRARWTAFSFIGIFFILAGIIVIGFFWNEARKNTPMPTIMSVPGMIIYDTEIKIDTTILNANDLANQIEAKKQEKIARDTVIKFNLIKKIPNVEEEKQLNINDFLLFINSQAPAQFTRSLEGSYMLGLYEREDGRYPFLVLKTKDYETGFAGMLEWEPKINEIVAPLFGVTQQTEIFIDRIVKNRDVRSTKSGSILYSFLDKNTVVITVNDLVLGDIIDRYIASQASR